MGQYLPSESKFEGVAKGASKYGTVVNTAKDDRERAWQRIDDLTKELHSIEGEGGAGSRDSNPKVRAILAEIKKTEAEYDAAHNRYLKEHDNADSADLGYQQPSRSTTADREKDNGRGEGIFEEAVAYAGDNWRLPRAQLTSKLMAKFSLSSQEAENVYYKAAEGQNEMEFGNASDPRVVEDAPDDFSIMVGGRKVREGLHKDEVQAALAEVKAELQNADLSCPECDGAVRRMKNPSNPDGNPVLGCEKCGKMWSDRAELDNAVKNGRSDLKLWRAALQVALDAGNSDGKRAIEAMDPQNLSPEEISQLQIIIQSGDPRDNHGGEPGPIIYGREDTAGRDNAKAGHEGCDDIGPCDVCGKPVCPDCGGTTDGGLLYHNGECKKKLAAEGKGGRMNDDIGGPDDLGEQADLDQIDRAAEGIEHEVAELRENAKRAFTFVDVQGEEDTVQAEDEASAWKAIAHKWGTAEAEIREWLTIKNLKNALKDARRTGDKEMEQELLKLIAEEKDPARLRDLENEKKPADMSDSEIQAEMERLIRGSADKSSMGGDHARYSDLYDEKARRYQEGKGVNNAKDWEAKCAYCRHPYKHHGGGSMSCELDRCDCAGFQEPEKNNAGGWYKCPECGKDMKAHCERCGADACAKCDPTLDGEQICEHCARNVDGAKYKNASVPSKFSKYRTGKEHFEGEGELAVYEFPDDATMDAFLSEVGGKPHPLGGRRAVLKNMPDGTLTDPERREEDGEGGIETEPKQNASGTKAVFKTDSAQFKRGAVGWVTQVMKESNKGWFSTEGPDGSGAFVYLEDLEIRNAVGMCRCGHDDEQHMAGGECAVCDCNDFTVGESRNDKAPDRSLFHEGISAGNARYGSGRQNDKISEEEISEEIEHHIKDKGMEPDKAAAAAYSEAGISKNK